MGKRNTQKPAVPEPAQRPKKIAKSVKPASKLDVLRVLNYLSLSVTVVIVAFLSGLWIITPQLPVPAAVGAPALGVSVAVLGGTGATGKAFLRELLSSPQIGRVLSVARRQLSMSDFPGLHSSEWAKFKQITADFDAIVGDSESEQLITPDILKDYDFAVSTLGTTRAQAGSDSEFRRVDYGFTLAFARAAHSAGITNFMVVTSAGAQSDSMFLYPRTKGEIERALVALPFTRVDVVRPGLLITDRSETRFGERLAQIVFPYLEFALPHRYRSITVQDVAKAMLHLLDRSFIVERINVFENEQLPAIAQWK
eukprot:TRINITY_DN6867_c0_g1_i1.p1 TRINITY_DN6867_c0_g1~~TRINITY_DN6867_c0_g1_i1.p1  ORF type:complete len:311 (-),score=60.79 TRINITY_DN6867_c0_g1_i1:783-1715(-)